MDVDEEGLLSKLTMAIPQVGSALGVDAKGALWPLSTLPPPAL